MDAKIPPVGELYIQAGPSGTFKQHSHTFFLFSQNFLAFCGNLTVFDKSWKRQLSPRTSTPAQPTSLLWWHHNPYLWRTNGDSSRTRHYEYLILDNFTETDLVYDDARLNCMSFLHGESMQELVARMVHIQTVNVSFVNQWLTAWSVTIVFLQGSSVHKFHACSFIGSCSRANFYHHDFTGWVPLREITPNILFMPQK